MIDIVKQKSVTVVVMGPDEQSALASLLRQLEQMKEQSGYDGKPFVIARNEWEILFHLRKELFLY